MAERRIGIDIGRTAVRVAEVETHQGRQPRLLRFAEAPVEPGSVDNGVVQRQAPVVAAVRRALRASGVRGKQAVLGMAGDRVYVRPLSVPPGPRDQVRASLPYLVQDGLPVAAANCLLDFHPIGPNGPMLDGLLVAVPTEAVRPNVDAVEKAGLTVAGVDLAAFGLVRAATRGHEHGVSAIVDVGADVTQIVVAEGDGPRLIRFGPVAGRVLTLELARSLGVDEAAAERLLRDGGALGRPEVEALVRAHVERLVDMVAQTIQYHAQAGGRPVDLVLLAGRGALVPGLGQHLATVTRLAVSYARVEGGFRVDGGAGAVLTASPVVACVACGLACGGDA